MPGPVKVKSERVTVRNKWIRLREQITADDSGTEILSVTTRNFANKDAGADISAMLVPESFNAIMITFLGAPADHAVAFKWKLYGYRGENGPAQNIANGTGFLGDVALTVHPITGEAATASYYADELTITAQVWPKLVSVVDVGGASGEIATIQFDALGIKYLRCELTFVGGTTEPTALEAIMTGF